MSIGSGEWWRDHPGCEYKYKIQIYILSVEQLLALVRRVVRAGQDPEGGLRGCPLGLPSGVTLWGHIRHPKGQPPPTRTNAHCYLSTESVLDDLRFCGTIGIVVDASI